MRWRRFGGLAGGTHSRSSPAHATWPCASPHYRRCCGPRLVPSALRLAAAAAPSRWIGTSARRRQRRRVPPRQRRCCQHRPATAASAPARTSTLPSPMLPPARRRRVSSLSWLTTCCQLPSRTSWRCVRAASGMRRSSRIASHIASRLPQLCEGRVTPPATAAAVPPPSPPGYVGCDVFSVRKGLGFITGDFARNDGRGGWRAGGSPTSPHFADENFTVRHAAAGVLTMANTGVHRNASAFMISTAPAPHLGTTRALSCVQMRGHIRRARCNRASAATPATQMGGTSPSAACWRAWMSCEESEACTPPRAGQPPASL